MTPCYICGGGMEEPRLDPRDMKTRPCSHCEYIIAECVNEADDDYEFVTDEEFGEDDFDDTEF